jgi:predicted nucleic acid-binding protein
MKLPFIKSYCIDTSVLIDLKRHYPKNEAAFKAIWQEIETLIAEGNMFTVKIVEKEIEKYQGKDDFLIKWINKHKNQLIYPMDSEIWNAGTKIMEKHPELLDKKKMMNGEDEADPFLIALAYVKGCTIITQESKDNLNKIPTVANKYKIKCMNLFEFFNAQGLGFVKK